MTRPRVVLAAALTLVAAACGDARDASVDAGLGPTTMRAVLILEPEQLAVGDVGMLTIAAQTPPDHLVLPPPFPEQPGCELLDVRSELEERAGSRWLHRSHYRFRALAAGRFVWPTADVVIEAPDGVRTALTLGERAVAILSVLPDFSLGRQPFGLRDPPGPVVTSDFAKGVAAGGVVTFALAVLWIRVRRPRGARARAPAASADEPTPQLRRGGPGWAIAELARARDALVADPRDASAIGANALREYVGWRHGLGVRAATTEDLERSRPEHVDRAFWSDFLRILRRYDAERFQKRTATSDFAAHVEACLDETERFLQVSVPRARESS